MLPNTYMNLKLSQLNCRQSRLSLEAIRMAISNSAGKLKQSYDDVRDMILAEEICRKDFGEFFGTNLALSVDDWGRGLVKSSKNKGRSRTQSRQQITC